MSNKPYYTTAFVKKDKRRKNSPWIGVLKHRNPNGCETVSKSFDRDEVRTKTQANAALATWKDEMELARNKLDSKMTVADYLDSYIAAREASGQVEPSTVLDYKKSASAIARAIPGLRMCDLDADAVMAMEGGMLASGISPTTIGKRHRLLKMVCSHAVERGDLSANPLDRVKPPKRKKPRQNAMEESERNRALTTLSSLEQTDIVIAAETALLVGMREGEICGLRISDVNLEEREVHVQRSIGHRVGGTYVKEVKTGVDRFVPIPKLLAYIYADRIDSMWRSYESMCSNAGIRTSNEAFGKLYLLGDVFGNYLDPGKLGREWKSISKTLGLVGACGDTANFLDLRHTCATNLAATGADVRNSASILGHDPTMFLTIYANEDRAAKRRIVDNAAATMWQEGGPDAE